MSAPQKFRKKPVEIEAMQYTGHNWVMVAAWAKSHGVRIASKGLSLLVHTLEGDMEARPGDWVIRGVEGEFYPCKPDIFAKTYDAVEAPVKRGVPILNSDTVPAGTKVIATRGGKVVYEVLETERIGGRYKYLRARLRDTRTGLSAGWRYLDTFSRLEES